MIFYMVRYLGILYIQCNETLDIYELKISKIKSM